MQLLNGLDLACAHVKLVVLLRISPDTIHAHLLILLSSDVVIIPDKTKYDESQKNTFELICDVIGDQNKMGIPLMILPELFKAIWIF